MRGRKPKPTNLKLLGGNPGKRPVDDGEPRPPVPESAPYVPRHLNDDARREWRRIAKVLLGLGLYTEVDRAALAMYCQAWGRWVEAERKVEETGGAILEAAETGNLYQNPWLNTANRAWEQVRKVLGEFGLSPATRTRLKVAMREEPDELEKLLLRRAK